MTKWEIYYLVGINRDLTAPGAPGFMIHITSRDIPGIIRLTNHDKKGYAYIVYACLFIHEIYVWGSNCLVISGNISMRLNNDVTWTGRNIIDIMNKYFTEKWNP